VLADWRWLAGWLAGWWLASARLLAFAALWLVVVLAGWPFLFNFPVKSTKNE
jgi:hypothetical protein